MKKKVLSTLLAVSMVATMVAGCGSDAGETTTDNSAAATEQEEAPADDTATDAVDPVANLIAATTGPVTLTVWASEEDQDLTTSRL